MSRSIVKVVEIPTDSDQEIPIRHFIGLPPEVSPSHYGTQAELPPAERLVIVQESEGFLLYRFTRTGAFAGDTWHASLDDAYHQARLEYGVQSTDWADERSDGWDEMLREIKDAFKGAELQ